MFENLKKKLSNAIKSFSRKEEDEIKQEEKVAEKIEERAQAREEPVAVEKRAPEKRVEKAIEEKKHEAKAERVEERREQGEAQKDSDFKLKLSVATKIKGVIFKEVRLTEPEIEDFLEVLKVSMLESDVSYDTTEEFLGNLKHTLTETKVNSRNIQAELVKDVRSSLLTVVSKTMPTIDIGKFVHERKSKRELPVKILFLGPNGTGKTTTIGKMTYMLKNMGFSCVMSASDTFRAAAIEQTEHHANALGVPVIKSTYGADPSSIAFDAVAYAKSHGIDAVLIDSAGRQETNKNLISEIQKMERVIKPDITVYVGESYSGNAIANQIKEFKSHIRVDGIILTKLDCDAKGGNAISIANVTGIPILFFGVGESYKDLIPYDPNMIIDAIVPNA